MQRDHEDGAGDLCSARGCFDLPHQGAAAFKIKVLRGKTTRGGEEETGEEQGWERGEGYCDQFHVSSNDVYILAEAEEKLPQTLACYRKGAGASISLTPSTHSLLSSSEKPSYSTQSDTITYLFFISLFQQGNIQTQDGCSVSSNGYCRSLVHRFIHNFLKCQPEIFAILENFWDIYNNFK